MLNVFDTLRTDSAAGLKEGGITPQFDIYGIRSGRLGVRLLRRAIRWLRARNPLTWPWKPGGSCGKKESALISLYEDTSA